MPGPGYLYRLKINKQTVLMYELQIGVPVKDLHCWQYVSIFVNFHAIVSRSRTVSARQTGVKTEFNAK